MEFRLVEILGSSPSATIPFCFSGVNFVEEVKRERMSLGEKSYGAITPQSRARGERSVEAGLLGSW